MSNQYTFKGKLLWFASALFFLYQYYVRASIGVMAGPIMADFGISASTFATMASLYYVGYGTAQLVFGPVVDTKGPVKAILIGLTVLLMAHFAISFRGPVNVLGDSYLVFCRFLTGVGSGAALLSMTKLSGYQWPKNKFSVVFPCVFALGVLGGMLAPQVVTYMLTLFHWVTAVHWMVAVGVVLLMLFWALRKSYLGDVGQLRFKQMLQRIVAWRALPRKVVMLAIADACGGGPLYVLGDVWGVLFLREGCGFSASQAAFSAASLYVGFASGSLLEPYFSKVFDYSKKIAADGLVAIALLTVVVTFNAQIPPAIMSVIFFVVGITCAYQVTVLRIVADSFDKKDIGRNVSFANACNMLGGFVFVWMFGLIMDFVDKPAFASGRHVYSLLSYQCAVVSFLAFSAICVIVVLGLKRFENPGNRN